MDEKERMRRAKRDELNAKGLELAEELKQCKTRRDRVLEHKIRRELRIIGNQIRRISSQLGEYTYSEDEEVELSPGVRISANDYSWIKK